MDSGHIGSVSCYSTNSVNCISGFVKAETGGKQREKHLDSTQVGKSVRDPSRQMKSCVNMKVIALKIHSYVPG